MIMFLQFSDSHSASQKLQYKFVLSFIMNDEFDL